MRSIPTLQDLYYLGNDSQRFSLDFAGSYEPSRLPHRRDWTTANDHWRGELRDFLKEHDVLDSRGRSVDAASQLALAQQIVMGKLWPKARNFGRCDACEPARRHDRRKVAN